MFVNKNLDKKSQKTLALALPHEFSKLPYSPVRFLPIGKKEGSMVDKRFLGGLCAAFVCIMPVPASTVSFLVIETGLGEESPANGSSSLWESALLDVFFDTGHIVSNAPVLRIPQRPSQDFPEEAREDFNEALNGGAEFFVIALLDYQGSPEDRGSKPRSVSLRLFRIKPYRFLFKQDYSGGGTALSAEEEFSGAKDAARAVISHLKD
jgi:hypothetical protein